MSVDPTAITGPLIHVVNVEAKSVEAADKIVQLLFAMKDPGIPIPLTVRVNQFEEKIMIYEEYADLAALVFIAESEAFSKFKDGMEGLLAKPVERHFYSERKFD